MTEGQGGGTPAGWYPDPEGNGERWWNGMSWGQLRQPPAGQPQQPRPPQYGQAQTYGQQPAQADAGQHAAQPQPGQHWGQQQEPQQPAQEPAGQGLRCVNCQFTDFTQAEFLLNTRSMTMFGLDAFNAAANCLICRRCGFIHWFAGR
ncbi:hypothetical protein BH24ACT9_BH24ACT9_04300 [soil metagenome]